MSPRPFVMWPDKRLRTPAEPVTEVTDEIRTIWDDMVDTMVAMPGVGLAAPQIGVMLRLAVVDGSDTGGQAVRLANPELLWASAEMRPHEEASPNLPGVSAKIERPAKVRVRYLDEGGAQAEREFEGLWSTSVQHQIDHLDGHVFIDRLSRVKREMILKRFRKARL
ncbi:peptide deformylase [Allosediminivita pacifica]|uniref:Peptide deformylase-like n=1 Tax=Allosediminivita pacifica TaxID=1267769 RepID=A0A2T6AXA5_9RHOB|nr:peptide deformylase [Allosediminivita pacifica]PTX48426.1 peptide deformylase [Allosediminivita pacifica]GGB10586.1 peptide deformylase [Allosediminivita pacifica]